MIVKVKKYDSYTMVDNCFINSSLSPTAMGLLLWCLSRPPAWRFSISGTLAAFNKNGKKMGEAALKSTMKELKEKGYLYARPQQRTKDGKVIPVDWEVYECPKDNPHFQKKAPASAKSANQADTTIDDVNTKSPVPSFPVPATSVPESSVAETSVPEASVPEYLGEININQGKNKSIYLSIEEESINQSIYLSDDDELTAEREEIRFELEYETILAQHPRAKLLVDVMVDILVEVDFYLVDSMSINGIDLSRNEVYEHLSQIKSDHIIAIIEAFEKSVKSPIRNLRAYLATALYNAVSPDAYALYYGG